MPIDVGQLTECASARISWTGGEGLEHRILVTPADAPVAPSLWDGISSTGSIEWNVDILRGQSIRIGVKKPGTLPETGDCPAGRILRRADGTTVPAPAPAPAPAPEPALSSNPPQPPPASNTETDPLPPAPTSRTTQEADHGTFEPFTSSVSPARPDSGPAPSGSVAGDSSIGAGVTQVSVMTRETQAWTDTARLNGTATVPPRSSHGGSTLSDPSGGLAVTGQAQGGESAHRNNMGVLVGGIAGGVGVSILLGVLICFCLRKRSMRRREAEEDREYHVFSDNINRSSASASASASHRRSARRSRSTTSRGRRTTQESRDAYDEKYGYMEELGPTPRQSRYSDGSGRDWQMPPPLLGVPTPTPGLIHVDTESVRSMGVRHIIDPKELRRSPSSPTEQSEAGTSIRGSVAGTDAGTVVGGKRGRWRSSISAFAASPIFSAFFTSGRPAAPSAPLSTAGKGMSGAEERFETLEDDDRAYDAIAIDADPSDGPGRPSEKGASTSGIDQRFTLTLPTALAPVLPAVSNSSDEGHSDVTHQTHTTLSNGTSRRPSSKAASRKSSATVKTTKTVPSPFSEQFSVPPVPEKRKSSSSGGTSANDHRSSFGAKSTKSASSRASRHVSGLAGLPALQYVDYGDDDDVPSVPSLPANTMPFEDFGFPAPPATQLAPPARKTDEAAVTVNTDGNGRPPGNSPHRSLISRPVSGVSSRTDPRSRSGSDATTRECEESDASCVTITARRVPVSAVGRVKSGMFERPRTVLMSSASTPSLRTPSDGSMGGTARPLSGMSTETSPGRIEAYEQPASSRNSKLSKGTGPEGGDGGRRTLVSGPRFSEAWSGWTPSPVESQETRSGDGHAV